MMSLLSYGQPVNSPVVPFIYGFPAPLPEYGLFSLEGFIPMDSQGFAVNFQTGPSVNPRDDVALHLGFSFTSATELTLNSIRNNNWDVPVRYPSCPVRKMDPFQMLILVQRKSFMVAFSNQHFCEFHHRIDPAVIRYIAVDGRVVINRLLLEFPGGFHPPPTLQPSYPAHGQLQGQVTPGYGYGAPVQNYSTQVPGSYGAGGSPAAASSSSSGFMGMLPAAGALGGLAALAAPLFYPGKQKKMSKMGRKQHGLFGGMGGVPGMGMLGGGNTGYGNSGSRGGMMAPALGAGLGAAALGYGMSRMKHGRRHGHGGGGGWGDGGYGRRSGSSSSSSSSSDSD